MAVTSNEVLQNILLSINNALTQADLPNDIRASLIDQYERTTILIRDGYQFSEIDLQNLPNTIRTETITLFNEVSETFNNASQVLHDNFQVELTKLTSYNITTEDANNILNTVLSYSESIKNDFEYYEDIYNQVNTINSDIVKVVRKLKMKNFGLTL